MGFLFLKGFVVNFSVYINTKMDNPSLLIAQTRKKKDAKRILTKYRSGFILDRFSEVVFYK